MHKHLGGERLLTEIDFARLSKLPEGQFPPELKDTLDTVDLVTSQTIPADCVTMYSQVLIEDLTSGHRQKLTLCYPKDAEPHQGFISVLSPVGASLLGQRLGATVSWRSPNQDRFSARIVELLFQPEATGDYTT
ncbi:MAG TPA: GreA/GreB family elongation factor [Hydrogenophaga sp.]